MVSKTEGKVQEIAGRAQQWLGEATGDDGLRAEGAGRELEGRTRVGAADVVSTLRGAARDNPIATLTVVAVLGAMIGARWARR